MDRSLEYLDLKSICIQKGELANLFSIIVWHIDDPVTYNNFSRCHRIANKVANNSKMLIQYKKIQFTTLLSYSGDDIKIPILPNGMYHGFIVDKRYTLVYKDGYAIERFYYPSNAVIGTAISVSKFDKRDSYINIFVKNKQCKYPLSEYDESKGMFVKEAIGWLVTRGNWMTSAVWENKLEVHRIYLNESAYNSERDTETVKPFKTFTNDADEIIYGYDVIKDPDFDREIVNYIYDLV